MRPGVPPLCNGVGTVPPWPDSCGRGLNFPAEMPAMPPLGMTGWHEVCSTFTSKPRCVGPTPAETRAQGTAHRGPPTGAYKPPSLKGDRGACHPRRRGPVLRRASVPGHIPAPVRGDGPKTPHRGHPRFGAVSQAQNRPRTRTGPLRPAVPRETVRGPAIRSRSAVLAGPCWPTVAGQDPLPRAVVPLGGTCLLNPAGRGPGERLQRPSRSASSASSASSWAKSRGGALDRRLVDY